MAEIILSPSFSEILLIWKTILMSVFSSVISFMVILITDVLSEHINEMWLGLFLSTVQCFSRTFRKSTKEISILVSETSEERKETPINKTQLVPDMPIWSSLFLVADEYILLVTKSTSLYTKF